MDRFGKCLYEKERQTRPALYDLRLEYAKKSLAGVNKKQGVFDD